MPVAAAAELHLGPIGRELRRAGAATMVQLQQFTTAKIAQEHIAIAHEHGPRAIPVVHRRGRIQRGQLGVFQLAGDAVGQRHRMKITQHTALALQ